MTREEQVKRVRRVLVPALGIPDGRGVGPLAERIVDALAQPVEKVDPTGDDWEGHCSWERKNGGGAKRCIEQCAHCRSTRNAGQERPA